MVLKRKLMRWVRVIIFWLYDNIGKPVLNWFYQHLQGGLPAIVQTPAPVNTDADPRKIITTLEDLDNAIEEAHQGFAISDDEGRRRLALIQFEPQYRFPEDPYSPEYAQAQMELYYQLSGRHSYNPTENEHNEFDLDAMVRAPYPYFTKSASTVGDQLLAQGYLIRAMNLGPGKRIVEFGPGWGNTTLHLAQMGYDVTAVEIEPNFVNLIRRRAAALGVGVNVIQADMTTYAPDTQYDAALFFECFHHSADHLALLRNLDTMIKPDGVLVFASEPVRNYAHPWGFVRTDGLTLWSIRRMGWFELSFDINYFLRTLLFYGWIPQQWQDDVTPMAEVFLAKKAHGEYRPAEITLPPDEAVTWHAPEKDLRYTTDKSVMSCARFKAVQAVEFCLSNAAPRDLDVTLMVGQTEQIVMLPAQSVEQVIRVDASDWQGHIEISSKTWNPQRDYGVGASRQVGVAVHWFRLIE